jgi:hypothetical protein
LAVQSISEILQTIARQRGRGDTQPLVLLHQIDGAPGERISHLPIEGELAQAWVALTGEPFRPHQAQALTALRRGEPVALRASSADVAMTMHLLLYAMLLADPAATALVLVPDEAAVNSARARVAQVNQDLPRPLHLTTTTLETHRRPDHYARVVIAPPEIVHSRLLRHHDRAWRFFWPRLRLVVLPDLQSYDGVAGAHLADLLLRVQRVATGHVGGQVPNLLGTLSDIADPEPALTALIGQPWRCIAADDGPRAPTTFAVWRGGAGRLRDAVEISTAMQRQGYQVHIACRPIECAALAPMIADIPRVTFGPDVVAGNVLVVAGYPGSHSSLWRMLRSSYQAVILVLGELPHEQALARHVDTLLSNPATSWPPPPNNAYVTAQHVLCAASEQPLTEQDVELWGAQDIVTRLVAQGQLVDLPDFEVAWKPTDAAGDPYAEFSPRSSGGGTIIARTEQSHAVGAITPAVYERWAFPSAALPPAVGGFRVMARDDEASAITLRLEGNGRRTYPLRRCEVTLRETRDTRTLSGGRPIGWGRVVVNEETYGYREATPTGPPTELALKPPLTSRWTAPACWFDLAVGVQVTGQFIGWSLAAALSLRALADLTDVVPCYDHEARRLYVVDAQPGGNGLAAWLYQHADEILPLAYDVALACRGDPLLEPLSRVDMDWLLALLGRRADEAVPIAQPRQAAALRATPPGRPEPIEGPPPAQERVLLTPPPADSRRLPSNAAKGPAPSLDRGEGIGDRRPAFGGSTMPPNDPPAPTKSQPTPVERHDTSPPSPDRRAADEQRHTPYRAAPPPADDPSPSPRPQGIPADRRGAPPDNTPPDTLSAPRDRRRLSRGPTTPAPSSAHATQKGLPGSQPTQKPTPTHPKPGREVLPPPGRSQPPPPAPDDERPPDPAALIERLRRQRQQREAQQGAARPTANRSNSRADSTENEAVEQRFAAGDRVFCLPYGDGEVRASRVDRGRELLVVAFPNHGELTIDPSVSLVRKLENTQPEDDNLL